MPSDEQALGVFLDGFAEALLVEFSDSPDDEVVPIGRLLLEAFEKEERRYPAELVEMTATVDTLRVRLRTLREQLALEAA